MRDPWPKRLTSTSINGGHARLERLKNRLCAAALRELSCAAQTITMETSVLTKNDLHWLCSFAVTREAHLSRIGHVCIPLHARLT